MSSVFNIFGLQEGGFNIVLVIPVAAVLVAVNLLFKFSVQKPAITKKAYVPKKQRVNNARKDENPSNSEKKWTRKQEKKIVHSSAKDLETSCDTTIAKPNKKQAGSGQSTKKNSPIKKQQIDIKTPAKTKISDKLSNSLINKEEEGDWQTVVKKKQKQTKPEEIIKTTVPHKTKKSPEKPNKNINKKTNVIEQEEAKPAAAIDLIHSKPLVQNQENDCANFVENTSVPTAFVSKVVEPTEGGEDAIRDKNVSNVAFDELGDDIWTNTKPQKKNRKKALRE